jgi:hypothetical protein
MDHDFDMEELFHAMAVHLVTLATDEFGDKDFCGQMIGNQAIRLQVLNDKGDKCLQVVGNDSLEVAQQMVLACFHNLSIEHLGALHLKPLNVHLQVGKDNERSS